MDQYQQLALTLAKNGHSILITGQAGCGKTYALKTIVSELQKTGKIVAVTATTGMAASHLKSAMTVHRYAGLLDGRFTTAQLINRINNDDELKVIKDRIINTEILVIDELSMLSQKIFDQLNHLFNAVRNRHENSVFGGIQLILSGDFYQLPPVPALEFQDDGKYCFQSEWWKQAVPHHVKLEVIHRQDQPHLINAIRELSQGKSSKETEQLLHELERPLFVPESEDVVKLYHLRYDVEIWNSQRLLEVQGEERVYTASDQGDCKQLDRHVPQKLHLKIGAPVILIANLTDSLVNGLAGKVLSLETEGPIIKFNSVKDAVQVKFHPFPVYDPKKCKNKGTRMQIPLNLSFGITVHKAQGMSLRYLEIDCRHMNIPGEIGVAIGRAVDIDGLRILNFYTRLLRPHPPLISEFYECNVVHINCDIDNLHCCSSKMHISAFPSCSDHDEIPECELLSESEVHFSTTHQDVLFIQESEPVPEISDEEFSQMLDTMEVQYVSDGELLNMVDTMEAQHGTSVDGTNTVGNKNETGTEHDDIAFVAGIEINDLLLNIKFLSAVTEEQHACNENIEFLYVSKHLVKSFLGKLYEQMNQLYQAHINTGNIITKNIRSFYGELHQFYISDEYRRLVHTLFDTNDVTAAQYNVALKLVQRLRHIFLEKAADPIIKQSENEANKKKGKIYVNSDGGRGKIRLIGGWAVAKLKFRRITLVRQNLYKASQQQMIENLKNEILLLECLESTEFELMQTSNDKESLQETSRKQNTRKGLTNIGDKCFDFFLLLDSCVRALETKENLHIHASNFYKYIARTIEQNISLYVAWVELFQCSTALNDSNCKLLFVEITQRYLNMSCGQFRKEYIRETQVIKKEAHRKQVKISGGKKHKDKWTFKSINSDQTENKISSHRRLQAEVEADNTFLETSLTKAQLQNLCLAYEVTFRKKDTKPVLCDLLQEVILTADSMHSPERLLEDMSTNNPPEDANPQDVTDGEQHHHLTAETIVNTSNVDQQDNNQVDTTDEQHNRLHVEPVLAISMEPEQTDEQTDNTPDVVLPPKSPIPGTSSVLEATSGKRRYSANANKTSTGKRSAKTAKWPCGICKNNCLTNAVCCDGCDTWHHLKCLKLKEVDPDEAWYCNTCQAEGDSL